MVIDQPVEIAHLAYTLFPADTRVKREALTAARTGRRVAVVALQGPGQAPEEMLGDIQVIRLPGKKSRGGPASYMLEYAAFVQRCRRLLARDARFAQTRVVHVHTLPDFLTWAARPAQRRGARLILDLHEIFPEFAASKYGGVLASIATPVARFLERDARRRADVTITVNRPIETLLAARGIGRPERIVLIHNSADPDEFGPLRAAEVPGSQTPLELVYHGTLTHLYGIDIAVRGVAQAVRQGLDVRFSILGDGPERERLAQLTATLGIEQHVRFEAPLPQRALPDRLSRAHAGLVPTRLNVMTQYSLSNKLLEYVHLGVPVLAARLPSYREYLSEEAAWFWSPGSPEGLARAIAAFQAAPPAARSARTARAQQDLEGIAWERERSRLLELYQELLEPSPHSTSAMRAAARPSP